MPKLDYAHIRFWIHLTSYRRDCISQRSSGCVVYISCNAQLKTVINKWQVKSQNIKCFSQWRCIMSFSSTYILSALQTQESWLYQFRLFPFLQQRCLFREAHHSSPSFWLVSKEFSANVVILPGLSNSKTDRWWESCSATPVQNIIFSCLLSDFLLVNVKNCPCSKTHSGGGIKQPANGLLRVEKLKPKDLAVKRWAISSVSRQPLTSLYWWGILFQYIWSMLRGRTKGF